LQKLCCWWDDDTLQCYKCVCFIDKFRGASVCDLMDTLFCAPDTSARSEGFRSSCEAVDDGGGGENALLEVGSAEVVLAMAI